MDKSPADLVAGANLVRLLRTCAAAHADNGFTFLSDTRGTEVPLTFAQLDQQARSVAAMLQGRGLAGQCALLCYPAGVDFLVGLFGCLYAGMIAVPAYPPRASRADSRLDSISANAGSRLVLSNTKIVRSRDRLTTHVPRLRDLEWLDTSALAEVAGPSWFEPQVKPDDPAILQYTSGSTGDPKGVVLTHANLLHNLARMQQLAGLRAEHHGVCWLPAFHDMGLIGNFLQAIFTGGCLTFFSPLTFAQDPLFWLQTVSARRAYGSGGPTFAYQHCLQAMTPERCRDLDLSCWQVAYVGAEPVKAAVLDHFAEVFAPYGFRRESFLPCYGLAEATLMVTGGDPAAPPVVRRFTRGALGQHRVEPDEAGLALVGCGQPLPDLEVRIVDPTTGEMLPGDRIGEIWVAGPSIGRGYWNRPEESAHTFGARCPASSGRSFLRTGDMGFFQDGELFISGRLKDLIILRGRNYYPHDLEAAVAEACPELSGQITAAFAIEDEASVHVLIAVEVPEKYPPGKGKEWLDRIRTSLAELFELEVHQLLLVKTGTIPRSSSGKIQHQECQRRYQAGELAVIETVGSEEGRAGGVSPLLRTEEQEANAPRSPLAPVQVWLVSRLARHLNVSADRIDLHRPFASYGLDSLAMLTLAGDLQTWLGRPLPPTLLYSAPTIAALARAVSRIPDGKSEDELAAAPSVPGPFNPLQVPVAVIGIGCRFPGAEGPEQFWQLLTSGTCAVGELPGERRGVSPLVTGAVASTRAGYLAEVEYFDAPFFGIAPREAVFIDPQHRLLLETAWHALEHAGVRPDRLAGRPVGVFIGISTNDYSRLLLTQGAGVDPYAGVGNSPSMAAHRISYHLDLRGPSLAVDTACSSSLVAVHLACQSLRTGECELALAGGVNLILAPELTEVLSRAGMLSAAGRCKTFDEAADGYVRGEGCGVVVLKPLPAAVRDGDRILAVLEASAINQDGRSNGITAPNGAAQTELLRRALRQAGRTAGEVSCLEAHGTGTALGDPIEFEAIHAALGRSTVPCALASVKTNLGHLEAAAGIAGLIKAVLQVHHGQVVPHLHLETLNPHLPPAAADESDRRRIRVGTTRFYIPQELAPWSGEPRLAGVSSFGFGGTNAHVLVSQPASEPLAPAISPPWHLLPLSARSEPALRESALRLADWLRDHPDVPLDKVCAAAGQGRCHFEHRLAMLTPAEAAHSATISDALQSWATQARSASTGIAGPGACTSGLGKPCRVAFLFTGQGAQYAGMGRQLDQTCVQFRTTLDRCQEILKEYGVTNLREALGNPTRLEQTNLAQPALFALEYALAQTFCSWGIEPAALLGHSVGEYVAACLAGVLTLEDALKLIARRGQLMHDCPEGAMLACFAPLDEVRVHLDRWGDCIELAAINGPEQVIVAGQPAAVVAFREELAAHGLETRLLNVRRAFHSVLMEPALPGLRELAAALPHRNPTIPLVSNLTGSFFSSAPAADYWASHARGVVQFASGVQSLWEAGITHFLELGPDAVLCRLGPACLQNEPAIWLSSLRRGGDDWVELLSNLGRLYVDGAEVRWESLNPAPGWRHLSLPTYPFERFRYWMEPRTEPGHQTESPSRGAVALPGGLQEIVGPLTSERAWRDPLVQFALLRKEFDKLAGAYIIATLRQLGWTPLPGEQVELASLTDRLQVIKPYQRLLQRLLEIGAEDGWLERVENGWRVLRTPDLADVNAHHAELLRCHPAFEAELELSHHCAGQMPSVMRGQVDPLQVLFGEQTATWTERLYRESPLARCYNDLVAGLVHNLVARLQVPDMTQPVRLLEVGGGTASTTAHVLPLLPPERVEYVFTDISKLFVAQASHRFRSYPFVRYQRFDIEQQPDSQGFAEGSYDLILAANVLHATTDLRRGVRVLHRLLAPGGVLVLLEGTGRRRLLDLIFGLTEGWWKFADLDLRPQYPLLPPGTWVKLLGEEGFSDCIAVPEPDSSLPDPDQAVILAGMPGKVQRRTDCQSVLQAPVADVPSPTFDRQALLAAPLSERRVLVLDYLQAQFRSILGVELTPADLDRPPQMLGLDSLMGIQLRNRIEADLGLSLSVVDLLKGLSLNQILDKMVEGIAEVPGEVPAEPLRKPQPPPPPDLTAEKVDQLPEESLDALLDSLLK